MKLIPSTTPFNAYEPFTAGDFARINGLDFEFVYPNHQDNHMPTHVPTNSEHAALHPDNDPNYDPTYDPQQTISDSMWSTPTDFHYAYGSKPIVSP